ncbi:hypothetical protein [Sutcliffiella cohnii]|uniref:hypothetical protein n=1 Tax=Sutcliffiella cohnii TaxID=33932 RepID=UPI0008336AD1|nr:hypothetical protein [Sutcliffiella cohnii]
MKEELEKKQLVDKLLPHSKHITTVRDWDNYAREHSLPSSTKIIKMFNTWNEFKNNLMIDTNKQPYTSSELLKIAEKHKKYLTTYQSWNEYAKKNGLPVSTTFLAHFKCSWNEFKRKLAIPISSPNWSKYSREEIEEVIQNHSQQFSSKLNWDSYSKKNNLPDYRTIKNFFTWEEVQRKANVKINKIYNEEELLAIAKEHSIHFTTMKKWNEYAKEKGLPSAIVFYRKLGAWNSIKAKLHL